MEKKIMKTKRMKTFVKPVLAASLGVIALSANIANAELIRAQSYFLFNVQFSENGYYIEETVRRVACPIVQESNRGNGNDSVYFVRDVTGKVVEQGVIVHPRVAYIESGDEPVGMLRRGRVEFKVPITAQLAGFEFWESRDQQGPSVRVDLSQAVDVKPVCELTLPPPDALRQ